MYTFITLILIIFGILQIVLFFKVWQMTNDVNEFKEMYKKVHLKELHQKQKPNQDNSTLSVGDLVIRTSDNKQMRIKEITKDGKYACYTNNGQFYEGDFGEEEIIIF